MIMLKYKCIVYNIIGLLFCSLSLAKLAILNLGKETCILFAYKNGDL